MKSGFMPVAAVMMAAQVCAPAAEPVMRSLFNGKDLTGWTGEGYVVEDGAIVCTPQGRNLVTEETFSSFILEFEFKLPPGGNNGLGLHYPGQGDSAYTGMELQILDNSAPQYKDLKDYQFHGSLYTLAPAAKTGLKPVGEWNHQRVSVLGPAILVELNGTIILRCNLDDINRQFPEHQGAKRRSGHLAWLGHGDRVAFRNIQIAEVPPAANVEGVKAAGYTRIFDGSSLVGWKHGATPPGNWCAANGILKHNGKKGDLTDLWSEQEYGDFTLVFDWRWSGRGPLMQRPLILPDGTEKKNADGTVATVEVEELDSGIYLRGNSKSQVNLWNWPVGSGEVYGYRVAGDSTPEVRAGVTPKVKADRPLGQWNRMKIVLKGEVLSVSLNGCVVLENARLPGIPASGAIALQHHGGAIDFANLWIKPE
ncbi:MAG: DUF1080 domain-containing protein [Verrucomicrobia bacterium]|nr:DUF1080 domain-containing protein [Verrucomicrobiota bacterium]